VKRYDLTEFENGWIIGNFFPSILRNENFEIAIKRYNLGDTEVRHYQRIATEVTFVVSGKIRMNDQIVVENQIIELQSLEEYDFEALEKSVVVCIKYPSIPKDKIISLPR
jgi:hypothetical protein